MSAQSNVRVLILGGGFAGLFAALHLRSLGCPLEIMLIDRESRFIFKPLLYELMSNEVQANVAWPRYEDLLGDRDITYVMGTVTQIDLNAQRVDLESGLSYDYRYLVMALGDSAGYFGIPGAAEHTFTFRTAADALGLAKHLRCQLQLATQAEDEAEKRSLLTTAIVGAGPTGVELAVTLADLLPKWYEQLGGDPQDLRVVVVQRSDDILPGDAGDGLRDTVKKAMGKRRMEVDLLLDTTVKEIGPGLLEYSRDGEYGALKASTIAWTAGSSTHSLIRDLPIAAERRERRGRPHVEPTLQLVGFPEVFAGGDCAVNVESPMPATAQVAYQQGRGIAKNIMAAIEQRELEPVSASIRGHLIKLGIEESAAELFGKVKIDGYAGHAIRQATYLSLLPTPARNLKVGAEWLTDEVFDRVLGV